MPEFRSFDWSTSTLGHRQMLFAICNEIRKQEGWTWTQLLKEAAVTGPVSTEYEQNFRKGRIHKVKAAQLYKWVWLMRPRRAGELYTALTTSGGKAKRVLTPVEAYTKLLFGKKNYSWDGPLDSDEPWPLDEDPAPENKPPTRGKRKR